MLARLFVLLVAWTAIEILLLVWIARETSVLVVLGLVLVTGLVGAWLARHQGLQALRRASADLEAGHMPADSLVDGLLILLAGVLLVIPGLLSDVIALVLLFPPSRRVVKAFFRRRLSTRVTSARFRTFDVGPDHDQIIDVKVIENPPSHLP